MTQTKQYPREDLVDRFRQFIADTFLLGDGDELDANRSLLEQGVIDSTGVIELVNHVEQEYGIQVRDSEVVPANFGSIHSLANYVSARCGTV